LGNTGLVSVVDVKNVFPQMHRRRLYEWTKRGLIRRISKGYYIFTDMELNEPLLYFIGNKLHDPSYISLHSALSWYGLIPEFVPQIASVSTKKTCNLKTGIGNFAYFSVKRSLMFGYDLVPSKIQKYCFKMAFPEKALLDLLYLYPSIKNREQFEELRLNSDIFNEKIRLEVLQSYLKLFANKALTERVNNLLEYMKNA